MSESTNDTAKTSETESSSSSESESSSEEESGEATPKATAAGDETRDEGAKSSASEATSKSEAESASTPEPPPPKAVADEKAVAGTGSEEASEKSSATLHSEGEPAETPAEAAPADVDDKLSAEVTISLSTTEEKTTEAPPGEEVRVARVVGQAKIDVIGKPEVAADASEVHHVYERTVVQQTQVHHRRWLINSRPATEALFTAHELNWTELNKPNLILQALIGHAHYTCACHVDLLRADWLQT